MFNEVVNNRVIISKKKIKLYKECIEFLGMKIEKGKIKLPDHIGKKILDFPNKIENTKKLQDFLGILNYARMYIKDLSQLVNLLYHKTKLGCQKFYNSSDIELVRKVKPIYKQWLELALPLKSEYKVIKTGTSELENTDGKLYYSLNQVNMIVRTLKRFVDTHYVSTKNLK